MRLTRAQKKKIAAKKLQDHLWTKAELDADGSRRNFLQPYDPIIASLCPAFIGVLRLLKRHLAVRLHPLDVGVQVGYQLQGCTPALRRGLVGAEFDKTRY